MAAAAVLVPRDAPLCCVAATVAEPSSPTARLTMAAIAGPRSAPHRLRYHSFPLAADVESSTRIVGRSRRASGGFAVTAALGRLSADTAALWFLALRADGFLDGGALAVPHALAAAARRTVADTELVVDTDAVFAHHRDGSVAFIDMEHLLARSDCAPCLATCVVTGAPLRPEALPARLRPLAEQCLALRDTERATAYAALGAYLLLDRYGSEAAQPALRALVASAVAAPCEAMPV